MLPSTCCNGRTCLLFFPGMCCILFSVWSGSTLESSPFSPAVSKVSCSSTFTAGMRNLSLAEMCVHYILSLKLPRENLSIPILAQNKHKKGGVLTFIHFFIPFQQPFHSSISSPSHSSRVSPTDAVNSGSGLLGGILLCLPFCLHFCSFFFCFLEWKRKRVTQGEKRRTLS